MITAHFPGNEPSLAVLLQRAPSLLVALPAAFVAFPDCAIRLALSIQPESELPANFSAEVP